MLGNNPGNSNQNTPPSSPRSTGGTTQLGTDMAAWDNRMLELMKHGAAIIAFRGAGSVNGISPEELPNVVSAITDHILEIRSSGRPVALMYDGDADKRAKPDIGAAFGMVADRLKEDTGVVIIAAQSEKYWKSSDPISSAGGTAYETYVFSPELKEQHNRLTQSEALASYQGYEQIFVGPAGKIALSQLSDLNDKAVAGGRSGVPITVFSTRNNHELDGEFEAKRNAESDPEKRAKIEANIAQRQSAPFGYLCSADGKLTVDASRYPALSVGIGHVGF